MIERLCASHHIAYREGSARKLQARSAGARTVAIGQTLVVIQTCSLSSGAPRPSVWEERKVSRFEVSGAPPLSREERSAESKERASMIQSAGYPFTILFWLDWHLFLEGGTWIIPIIRRGSG